MEMFLQVYGFLLSEDCSFLFVNKIAEIKHLNPKNLSQGFPVLSRNTWESGM